MSQILSVDGESDGLYGEIFAIGAVVLNEKGIQDSFVGHFLPHSFTDKWVEENILPEVKLLPRYSNGKELRQAFWDFYQKYKDAKILGDVIFPVEARLFRDCILDDPVDRTWKGPFPLYDFSTILHNHPSLAKMKRLELAKLWNDTGLLTDLITSLGIKEVKEHNPLHDALISGYLFQNYSRYLK